MRGHDNHVLVLVGGISISSEADVYPNGGNRHNKTCKQDVEEIEAYRASFGFSADEIVTRKTAWSYLNHLMSPLRCLHLQIVKLE
ncbi:hypothetical protein OPV22_019249 [Ensete ventricosum]|uniref:Uncharacterized protein n=1 Tax=Ensete ventricosum TaxID=4639 RepID=A0AAV8QKK2_ENSVE|nr:hypothetical protein OPV22_019249 [Ensete ventricosum]